ncbi:hypothetical protein CHLRE_09g401600v5 [Chlamydomonas reinhardtii]|uniref:DNA/RNA-binding protein Alba-like domain-containing protein n=1 Tax=Chlamydomonas reinhardtii TaxID=3055 RepID=A8J1I6_CHLRE|nr:uncharacterized protein CHLRE_09g401600v5 [Chlamydomonas reinhardtii]PNW78331.1 hypothetical protein CHLRE_09g401600v5 [Chlamydomonas reinhardtii]|eukprot:XP_001695217.1 predicted protein [Chlamydomonas reinhardtii]
MSDAAAGRQPNRVQVSSNKKPLQFYLNLSKRLLNEYGEVELSALGLAVSNMVTVAEILKKDGWAVEKSIRTGLELLEHSAAVEEDGEGGAAPAAGGRSVSKPKMEVVLAKSADFDRLFAEHPPPPRGPKAAAADGEGEEVEAE